MHAGVTGGVHIGLDQELHAVAAVGVVVRLAAGRQLEEVPRTAIGVLFARGGVKEGVSSVHVCHRLCDLVRHHADHALQCLVVVHGLADGRWEDGGHLRIEMK